MKEKKRCYYLHREPSMEKQNTVTIHFQAEERVDLRIVDVQFFWGEHEKDEEGSRLIAFTIDGTHDKYLTLKYPNEERSYTSLNFTVRDETSQTQDRVQLPLNGGDPVFKEMMYME